MFEFLMMAALLQKVIRAFFLISTNFYYFTEKDFHCVSDQVLGWISFVG